MGAHDTRGQSKWPLKNLMITSQTKINQYVLYSIQFDSNFSTMPLKHTLLHNINMIDSDTSVCLLVCALQTIYSYRKMNICILIGPGAYTRPLPWRSRKYKQCTCQGSNTIQFRQLKFTNCSHTIHSNIHATPIIWPRLADLDTCTYNAYQIIPIKKKIQQCDV